MAGTSNPSLVELAAACDRLKRALGAVQCALFDLHEAFLRASPDQLQTLQHDARACLERIKALSTRYPT